MDQDIMLINIQENKPRTPKGFKFVLLLTTLITFAGTSVFFLFLSLCINFEANFKDVYSPLNLLTFFGTFAVCFVACISIWISKKPFSLILTCCIRIIGLSYIIISMISPHVSGYTYSFRVASFKDFVLFDGIYLFPGVLILLFSYLLRYGDLYQHHIDETI